MLLTFALFYFLYIPLFNFFSREKIIYIKKRRENKSNLFFFLLGIKKKIREREGHNFIFGTNNNNTKKKVEDLFSSSSSFFTFYKLEFYHFAFLKEGEFIIKMSQTETSTSSEEATKGPTSNNLAQVVPRADIGKAEIVTTTSNGSNKKGKINSSRGFLYHILS